MRNVLAQSGLLALIIVSTGVLASESAPKSLTAVYSDLAPVIDGKLDDAAWKDAAVIEDLHMIEPEDHAPASEPSRIYVLYTHEALYVGGQFWDQEPDKISVHVLRQGDFSWGEDGMSVIISPMNNGRNGYMFDMNVNGVRNQALLSNVTDENWQWQGIWHGAGHRTKDGWTGEMEIPFKTLSFDPDKDTWGINFTRWIGRRNERLGWVSHNYTQTPGSSGIIIGMEDMHQGIGLDVVPGLRVAQYKNWNPASDSSELEPSLDVFYKLTPALTGALTFNTDFSGTTADARQVNLTRFGLFYPEQRGFFLQDSDIFNFGGISSRDRETTMNQVEKQNGRPFFSRRMGLGEDGAVVDIKGGAKLTGRVGRWSIGFLDIAQSKFDAPGTTNLMVARLSANLFEESSIGAIVTDGNPDSEIGNTVVGVDFNYANTRLKNDKIVTGNAWYQRSYTEDVSGDDAAYGFTIAAPNKNSWRGGIGFKEIQSNFYPALGFAHRADIRDYTLEAGYNYRPESDWLRTIYSGVDAERIDRIDGTLESEYVNFRIAEFENNSNDKLKLQISSSKENLFEPFEIFDGVIVPVGEYSYTNYCVHTESGEHRTLSNQTYVCDGDFLSGTQLGAGTNVTWRPSQHLKFAAGLDINKIELPEGSFITRLASVRADIAFTRAWSWENYVQYDNYSNSVGVNSIVRYLPRAGREMVIVVNREFAETGLDRRFRSTSQDLIFKIAYIFRF